MTAGERRQVRAPGRQLVASVGFLVGKAPQGILRIPSIGLESKFFDISEMIYLCEQAFEQNHRPAPAEQVRSWRQHTQQEEVPMPIETVSAAGTAKSQVRPTFVVSVQYRRNATWQGTVRWVEREETRAFHSMLELMRLMDEAISQSGQGIRPVGWGEPGEAAPQD